MLHNICVDRWLLNHPRSYVNKRRIWPDVPDQIAVDDPMPDDDSIIGRLHNNYANARFTSSDNSVRSQLLEDIYDAGIIATSDTEFNEL